jgi:hypothetical protein
MAAVAKYGHYRGLIEKNQAVTLSRHLGTFKGLDLELKLMDT